MKGQKPEKVLFRSFKARLNTILVRIGKTKKETILISLRIARELIKLLNRL